MGVKPNGLAFDPARGILIAANIGDASIADSHTVSVVDIARRERIAEVKVPGRTRWTIYDAARETFFVNIASPARIVAIDAREPTRVAKVYEVPADGPHGLDFDAATGRLLCACDAGVLIAIDAASGRVLGDVPLSGPPDVIFLHQQSGRLYVAIGEPGVIDVIDIGQCAVRRWCRRKRAHTRWHSTGRETKSMRSCPNRIAPRYSSIRHNIPPQLLLEGWRADFIGAPTCRPGEWPVAHTTLRLFMVTDGIDWRFDAPIPCTTCREEAVAMAGHRGPCDCWR